MIVAASASAADRRELRRHWPAVLACFVTAVFGWGFGFSGTSVYLAELQRLHGWPTALIASAITAYYLIGAACLVGVHTVLQRLGAARLLSAGTILLGLGATIFSRSEHPWQLYAGAVPMALGWAGCTSTAISTTLALYFRRQRGIAISLALNGASAAGFTVAPLLVWLTRRIGLGNAVPLTAVALLALVLPLIRFGIANRNLADDAAPEHLARPVAPPSARDIVRSWRFWSVALPFALALAAQVGLIVHLVSFLLPHLGPTGAGLGLAITSVAAMTGRLGLGTIIDRLHQRRSSAACFALQALGLGLMLTFRNRPEALYAGCVLFGLSVGNVITFPSLIVQREFPSAAFGPVIGLSTAVGQFTFALAPALLGIVRDMLGGYGGVLILCLALQVIAAALVLAGPAPARSRSIVSTVP